MRRGFRHGAAAAGLAGCDAALAAGLAQPAIVRARGVLKCESERESMSVAAGVWWRDVLGGMIRGLGGYCSGGASREASSCGGKGLCLFASVRSVIEYTPLKVTLNPHARTAEPEHSARQCMPSHVFTRDASMRERVLMS